MVSKENPDMLVPVVVYVQITLTKGIKTNV